MLRRKDTALLDTSELRPIVILFDFLPISTEVTQSRNDYIIRETYLKIMAILGEGM